ncbi:MAG: DNA polymerase I [Gammaproteobacteria bacterium]|nr:DNA polymerase I [Gammaproteobacteria bacterium]
MAEKLLMLVDGSSYLFRAYHALPPLNNRDDEPTGAIYGVINMVRSLLKEHQPDYIAMVFDPAGKTFRHDLYPDYKANRGDTPEDLLTQIAPLYEILEAMGLPLIIVDGVEADDVIGTLAQQAQQANLKTIISTGDKDMTQLVNSKVTLINTMNNSTLDRDKVKEKFGVKPEQIIDYLTLIGDTSDNVPGVTKVGPKTAAKWLSQYESLDNLVRHSDEIGGKVGDNLRQALEQLPLMRELITIKCDVTLSEPVEKMTQRQPDNDKLAQLFKRLEFKRWLKELDNSNGDSEVAPHHYRMIDDETTFKRYLNKLKKAKLIAFDSETTSLNYMQAEIVGLSFAIDDNEGVYLPLAHDYMGAPEQLDREQVLKQLQPLLEDENIKKVGQNLKYDKEVLANYDITLRGIEFDTMLESYLLDSIATRHDMDSLARKYLDYQCISYESVCGKGVKQITFNQVSLEQATPYAAEDAVVTMRLHNILWPQLAANKRLTQLFNEVELPLLSVLTRMERHGVLIDCELLAKQSRVTGKRLAELEEKVYRQAGTMFNLNSPKQLREILFEQQKLPALKKTPTGQISTAEEVLQELALNFPLPKLILEYRSLNKLKSTYIDRLPEQVNPNSGRVHTSYHQAVTSTGRLSSSDPNLQNIPTRSDEGRQIRQAFIAPEGYKIVAADYSQIELRIMAHLSGDSGLQEAFHNNLDIHAATAAQVFVVPLEQVNSEQRRKAKAINFGLIYGMSAFGLAKQLGVDRSVAESYIEAYFHQYPGVKAYMDKTRERAREHGFVETLLGRRLYLPEINAKKRQRQMAAERVAINAPMQGTAADLIKLAMVAINHWLLDSAIDAKMVMQVHDELVFEVAETSLTEVVEQIRQMMEHVPRLDIPLIVDIGIGENWDEAH